MINRRELLLALGAGGISVAASAHDVQDVKSQSSKNTRPKHDMSGYGIPTGPPQKVAMLIYPDMTALDLIGPNQILSALGNIQVQLVAKELRPIKTDSGITITPDVAFKDCPSDLTIFFVPGGSQGTVSVMNDRETLAFVADRGRKAKFVTSVCTGSMVLAAAGLLQGYKATSHWAVRDLLKEFGATPVRERVVIDRNRITGAGVTAGIDFGLKLAAKLRNEKYAKALQLGFEYDPKPPYNAGTPEGAGEDISGMMEAMYFPVRTQMLAIAKRSKTRG